MEYKVYVKTNESGHITAVNSSAFLSNTKGWTEIDSGSGDKYHHAQGNYLPEPILTEGGAYRYRLADGSVVRRSDAELEKEMVEYASAPTQLDRIEAQVAYTAMMTDTLLEV